MTDAARRLGVSAGSAARATVLARLEAAVRPRPLARLEDVVLWVEAWAVANDLRWVRTEAQALRGDLSPLRSRPLAQLTGERPNLHFVASDVFGRRAELADATPDGRGGWSLRLCPELEAHLELLLETGVWPLWLASEQVRFLPLGASELPRTRELQQALVTVGWRCAVQEEGPLAGRIHAAARARVPLLVILGPKERGAGRLALRPRGASQLTIAREELASWLARAARWEPYDTLFAEESSARASSKGDEVALAAPNRRQ